MSVIAQAIADRQGEIDRLQAEIKALTDVEQLLGASAPAARSTSRRSSPRKATAASSESQPEVKPQRKRREMTAAEKKAVSERMTAYWAERRKKAPKKKAPRSRQLQLPAPVLDTVLDNREPVPVDRHPDRHQVNGTPAIRPSPRVSGGCRAPVRPRGRRLAVCSIILFASSRRITKCWRETLTSSAVPSRS